MTNKYREELATNIKPEVLAIADAMKKAAEIDDNGKITIGKDFYESALPDGLTMPLVKRLQDHESQLLSAATIVNAELAIPFFKKHKDIDVSPLKLQMGKNRIETVTKRTSDVRNVQTGEVTTVYGTTTAKYRAAGGNGSSGALRASRDYAQALGAKILAS